MSLFAKLFTWAHEQPRLCADLPCIGGTIKNQAEDFVVEEQPATPASGFGQHRLLWLEKRQLDTAGLLRHLSHVLNISSSDIGVAGMKDAMAITRQWVSVPAASEALLGAVNSENVQLLDVQAHDQKLRTGDLLGNFFKIRVRGVHPGALASAQAMGARLERLAVPNYFGLQRFGHEGNTLQLGLELLAGKRGRRVDQRLGRLALCAVQSALFNRVLAQRLVSEQLHRLLLGEVLLETASNDVFWALDSEQEQQRFAALELLPTGPLFGSKMRTPRRQVLALEQQILNESAVDPMALLGQRKAIPGDRRALLAVLRRWSVTAIAEHDLVLSFELPPGCYATVVLAEVCGVPQSQMVA